MLFRCLITTIITAISMPKTEGSYPEIIIKKNHERRLLKGHLWAFSNELVDVRKDLPAGTVVRLLREFDKKPFALAFYHPNSLISARIISRDVKTEIDRIFFKQRISDAASKRAFLLKERNAIRLVHSESDLLPGLVIEQYNDIITFQIVSAGMEAFKDDIIAVIKELFKPKTIIEKNSSHLRTLEGLSEIEGIVFGSDTTTSIHDRAGTTFEVSLLAGQKTGFYLDQMDNRVAIVRYIKPTSTVLDLFCNEGGFALNAARAGAASITAVDSSADALKGLSNNITLNTISTEIKTVKTDCFDFIRSNDEFFDLIVLDPPSLVKSKKHIPAATKAYFDLHRAAIKRLKPNGILVTASCSHHFGRNDLLDVIRNAGTDTARTITILEEHGAGADHPVHTMMPETEYLKFFILRVA